MRQLLVAPASEKESKCPAFATAAGNRVVWVVVWVIVP